MRVTDASSQHEWKQAAQAHFQRWSQHYDRDILHTLIFEPSYRRVLTQLRQWHRRGEAIGSLLDIGCGTGTQAIRCLGMPGVEQVTGLDLSEEMIRQADEKAQDGGFSDHADFLVGDSETLPFSDGSFDVVTCCNSFHHYPDQQRAMDEMFRVLRPNGRVMVIDGYRDNPVGWFIFDVAVTRVEKQVYHCSAADFQRLFDAAGFTRHQQHVFGVTPPILANMAYRGNVDEASKPA